MKSRHDISWPVLTAYDADHLARIAMPIGGIGTGTVSLGGRGNLIDWEVMDRPAKGFTPGFSHDSAPFFALRTEQAGQAAVGRLLEGPVPAEEYEGARGSRARNHGLPRFSNCSFSAAYPLGQVHLSDPDMPVSVTIQAFNPLIPGNADDSGIPIAVLRFVIVNRTRKKTEFSVCGTVPNFTGLSSGGRRARNVFRKQGGLQGLLLNSSGVPETARDCGSLALSTLADQGVSFRTAWSPIHWGNGLLDFWEDFVSDGKLDARHGKDDARQPASLCVKSALPPGGRRTVTFLLTWHFPNRQTWTPARRATTADNVGNYYAAMGRNAWDIAVRTLPRLASLEETTVKFVKAFCESDMPHAVKEAALFNLSTLRTQTCFRTSDGRFYGWEGCDDSDGCCPGSCTHVWNYEQATAFLFGDLARSMREIEFLHATRQNGLMDFRIPLPLGRRNARPVAAADGQMGCVMKLYRDWQLSGDDAFLRRLWPDARRAIEFCWIPGGWDADMDGVMEGCQHNTMDVEYYGPNPQMTGWYLGALRAAEEMARRIGEVDFADTCSRLFRNGSAMTDERLFNGEYYEHRIEMPRLGIAQGLRSGMGSENPAQPDFQLGEGCLIDQLAGQYQAHVCGLGYLLKKSHIRKALRSVYRYNRKTDFSAHFNCYRSFVLGGESAMLMAAYPGTRPARPFPYFTEVMTGFEYTAAVGMLYEGQTSAGLKCISDIRERYDGRKRNPFDEAECGHHYARAMASWAAILALSGFQYSAVTGQMKFTSVPGTYFWSTGSAWGTCRISMKNGRTVPALKILYGKLHLEELTAV